MRWQKILGVCVAVVFGFLIVAPHRYEPAKTHQGTACWGMDACHGHGRAPGWQQG